MIARDAAVENVLKKMRAALDRDKHWSEMYGASGMTKRKHEDEVQLSSRVPRSFRDRINADAVVAGCSVGDLIMRMHQSLDPKARRRVERSLGRLGTALNDTRIPEDAMRDVSAAMADLRAAIHAVIP